MYSLSRTLKILNCVLKQKSYSVLDKNKCRAVIKLSNTFSFSACYSEDAKDKQVQSPLANLLVKESLDKKSPDQKSHTEDEESKKQRESSWRTMKLTLIFFGISFTCLGGYLIVTLGSPENDEKGHPIRDELSGLPIWKQYILRTYRELDYYRRLIKEPSRMKLLPDPLEYPYLQPKYTLVLELTDVLVHPDWTYSTGWRFKKRPGLDFFLETLHNNYELVIYTAEQGMTVFPLIEAIDPKNLIAYKLVRDATLFTGGHHVKSLDNLNRDLSKVIVVDWNAKSVKFHSENLFNVKRWDGKDDDMSLFDLALFLKTISDNDIEDVREVLRNYSKYDDPVAAFRENQKKYIDHLEAEAAAQKGIEQSKSKRWVPSFLRRNTT